MVWFFAILGTIIGAGSRYFPGYATGGLFGFLLAMLFLYKKRLDTLE